MAHQSTAGLPLDALDARLRVLMPSWSCFTAGVQGVQLAASKFAHGQSCPTYLLQWRTGGEVVADAVLRRRPIGVDIASAHAVEREYRVIAALHAHGAECGVPVPVPLVLDTSALPLGAAYYVMSRVPGTVHHDPAFPRYHPDSRRSAYRDAVRVLARIHAVPVAAVGLADLSGAAAAAASATGAPSPSSRSDEVSSSGDGSSGGSASSFFQRQLRRLASVSAAQAAHAPPLVGLSEAVAWFRGHLPPAESALVHGDYKIDNLVLQEGPPLASGHPSLRVSGVLDWELVSLGHPLTDLANLAAAHWVPYAPGSGTLCGLGGVDVGWAETGIPTETELIGLYCEAAGRDPAPVASQWPFHKAWWLFRYAVIAQGIAARSARGVASSAAAAAAGAFAPVLMEGALGEMGLTVAPRPPGALDARL